MGDQLKNAAGVQPELKNIIIMPAQVDSVAADVATMKSDFNALLAKLRAAGLLKG